jgi:transposase
MQSLLYHGFGIKDVEYLKTSYEGGAIHIHVRTKKEKLCCSNCESKKVTKKGAINRTFRTVPIGLKAVYIVADVQRLECHECGMVRQESLTWADKKKLIPVD